MNKNSKLCPVRDEVKQPAKHRLITLSLIILASTGFSIEVEASDFKVRIVKEQSPIAEVVDLLDNLFD